VTIHHTSVRRVVRSAHARDLRWARVDRCVNGLVSAILWPLTACGAAVLLIGFSRRFKYDTALNAPSLVAARAAIAKAEATI